MKKRKKVYIAGPYTQGDPVVNTRKAILTGDRLFSLGFKVYIPHLNLLWHIVTPRLPEDWYRHDLWWLEECDVLLRLPGESWGADKEVAKARELGLKIYMDINQLIRREQ